MSADFLGELGWKIWETMAEIARLDGDSGAIQIDFVDRVFTTKAGMELGIQRHVQVLSLSNTISILELIGINGCRLTVHNWVQRADLEPIGDREPAKIALDEAVVKIDGEQYSSFAAVEHDTNVFLHVELYPTRTTMATKLMLKKLEEKLDIDEAEFYVDGAPWLQAGLLELGMHFRYETHGDNNRVEREF